MHALSAPHAMAPLRAALQGVAAPMAPALEHSLEPWLPSDRVVPRVLAGPPLAGPAGAGSLLGPLGAGHPARHRGHGPLWPRPPVAPGGVLASPAVAGMAPSL